MKTLYTVDQIAEWRKQAKVANLKNHKILNKYTNKQLTEIFNGIGSDGFPEWLRISISKLHPSLMAVALIHDVEWYERELKTKNNIKIHQDKDKRDFNNSNERFDFNATLMAKYNYAWYSAYRYWVEWDGYKFSKLCNTNLGFKWWKE